MGRDNLSGMGDTRVNNCTVLNFNYIYFILLIS